MKKLKWFALVLVIAGAVHAALLFGTPYMVMLALNYSVGKSEGYGKLYIAEQAQAGRDRIVRSSPDLLYSACAFKMSDGPLRVTAPALPTYMSLSFFAHNTDNFFSLNDKQAPNGIDVVLAKKGEKVDLPEGAQLVETDSPYGFILLRYYLGNKQVFEFDGVRKLAKCELL